MLTSAAVKVHARRLGFDLCGVAPATGMPELARIHDWVARGFHGEMRYLERSADVRADVTRFLPGARSVVMTATNYFTGADPTPGPVPSVARYARGEDYHLVLQERLDALLAWMQEATDRPFDAAVFVDKHWVQERVVAAYAGLGWIGKHSLLINQDLGSWVLLAGGATTLPLTPDALVADQCGACTLCIDACPTGAIVGEREVDARRCISYLTIEKDGVFDPREKAAVAGHLFGCDVCQEVCPWNRFSVPSKVEDFKPNQDLLDLTLSEWLEISDETWNKLSFESPIKRAGKGNFQRNIRFIS